jgi:uncharacterized membrane protein
MIEWIIIVGLAIAMYIIIYKYEKKMDKLHNMIEENKESIAHNHHRINKNHERLEEHHNFIERMWVTLPKDGEDKK